jgi:antibiotic biosynthesis monooxygenase (ABM) superfamily enzyme
MTMSADLLHSWFIKPMQISGIWRLAMLVPLAFSISIVLKTLRCRQLRSIPLASLVLAVSIVGGMMALGAALLLIFQLMA